MITKKSETGQKRLPERVLALAGSVECVIYYNMDYYICALKYVWGDKE